MLRLATSRTLILLSSFIVAALPTFAATTIFSESFSTNGILNGMSPDVGGTWSGSSGLTVEDGVLDTARSNTSSPDSISASFTQALGSGEILGLSIVTTETQGLFATNGYAGLTLYAGGTEYFFIGSPGLVDEWGITGTGLSASTQTFTPALTAEAQTVYFTYEYDTGDWSLNIGGENLNGTGVANLEIDSVGIVSDGYNIADIAISSIGLQLVPEPGSYALFFAGGLLGLLALRRRITK